MRPEEYGIMPPLEYEGFTIDKYFRIFKNGQHVFRSRWQECLTLEEAKLLIDQSNWKRMEQNITRTEQPEVELMEHEEVYWNNRRDEEERIEQHYEIELIEQSVA